MKTTLSNLFKLRKIHFDYVYTSHLHTTSLIGLLIKLRIINKKHFIGRESTSIFRRFSGKQLFVFKSLYSIGYSSVDLLINQTEYMKEQLIEGLPWLEKKTNIQVIPNPINLKAIQNIQLSTEKVHPREFIVSAGRLIPEKGYDILIEAFSEIAKEHPHLDLLILGEGHKRQELEEQIRILKLEDRIFLKGHVANVYDFFNQASLCVVASRVEGFPNVLLQMMSQNSKVVSTKCAGGIEDLKGVVCTEPGDIEDLKNKIKSEVIINKNSNNFLFQKELEERSLEKFFERINLNLIK